jgi:3',5'-cyclic AMP phosphodiesterase CpdA
VRLVHLTDPHLTALPGRRPPLSAGKRLLSWLSWQRRRRHVHRPDRLAALVASLRAEAPDAWAITGDLCQTGTHGEVRAARRWLEELDTPDRMLLVPGNHDVFARDSAPLVRNQWAPFLHADDQALDRPAVRRFGDVVLIGLNSAIATPVTRATGRLGEALRTALAAELQRHRGLARIVLLHHPPLPGVTKARKALIDADRLTALLRDHGAALVLHGHLHRNAEWHGLAATGDAAVYCTASASATAGPHGASGRIFDIERVDKGFRIEMRLLQLDDDDTLRAVATRSWLSPG